MADTRIDIERLLGGVEDLLLDANDPATVTQNRLVGETTQSVTITKVNMNTIPYEGKLGDSNFVSLADKINEIEADKDKYIAYTADGGIGIVSGDAGLIWDGGALGSNEIGIVQKLSNGNYRWIGKTTVGSDNWQFRGRVSGLNGVNPDEYVTKAQLDDVANSQVQSDWNVTDTSDSAYIKNKPTIPEYSYATTSTAGIVEMATDDEALAGIDTTRYVTPAQLAAFSEANGGSDLLAFLNKGAYIARFPQISGLTIEEIDKGIGVKTLDSYINVTEVNYDYGVVGDKLADSNTYEFGVYASKGTFEWQVKTQYSEGTLTPYFRLYVNDIVVGTEDSLVYDGTRNVFTFTTDSVSYISATIGNYNLDDAHSWAIIRRSF